MLGLARPGAHRHALAKGWIIVHMQAGAAEHPRHPQAAQALKGQIQHMAMAVARLLHGAEYRPRLPVSGKIHRAHIQRDFIYIGFVGHGDSFLPSKCLLRSIPQAEGFSQHGFFRGRAPRIDNPRRRW